MTSGTKIRSGELLVWLLSALLLSSLTTTAAADSHRKGGDTSMKRGDGTLTIQGTRTAAGNIIAATGPKQGKPCGSAGREPPRQETGIVFSCTLDGKAATCSCTATCTATCKQSKVMGQGNTYVDRCENPTVCNVTLTGSGGVTIPEVQPVL